ncbi:hypothetical protein [Bacillus sp. MUM 13]|nr:hypothetical protein [Bacillus sp. MUM 13]
MKIEKFKLCQQPANKPVLPRAGYKSSAVNERKQMKEFLYKRKKSSIL